MVHIPIDRRRQRLVPETRREIQPATIDLGVWPIALTLAIIASLETRLGPESRRQAGSLEALAPTNRERKAQGFGILVSGLLGGLPINALIVRSSANIHAGGRTKMSCFIRGIPLLLSVSFVARFPNAIPLAAILLLTRYKLAKPSLIIGMYPKGVNQFTPPFLLPATVAIIFCGCGKTYRF